MCSNQFASTVTTPEVPLVMSNESHNAFDTKQPKRRMSTVSLESLNVEEEKEKRTVHFAEYVSFVPSPSPLDRLLEDDITSYSELWYQLSDLALFRDEARLICREMRRQDELEPTYNPKLLRLSSCLSQCTTSDDDESNTTITTSTRGLEQRSCLERQRRKYLAGRFILKAAQQGTCPQRLALVSQRLTSWASELAREEAQRDHVQAYPAASHQNKNNNNNNNKRSRTEAASTTTTTLEPERCVRARV